MDERRLISLDGWAAGFAVLGTAVTLCVVGYDPVSGDNWLGEPGNGLARELTDALGSAVFAMLAAWAMLAVHLTVRRDWPRWAARVAGWTMIQVVAVVAADWTAFNLGSGPQTAGGGAVGAWLSAWLGQAFSPAWQVVLVAATFVLGASLATEYFVVPSLRAIRLGLRGLLGILRWGKSLLASDTPEAAPAAITKRRTSSKATGDDGIPIVRLTAPSTSEIAGDTETVTAEPAAADVVAPTLRIVRPGPAPDSERFQDYQLPPLTLLEDTLPFPHEEHDQHLRERAILLEKTFKDFDLNVRVVGINTGPVITQYEVALQTGLRVYKVTCLADDLAAPTCASPECAWWRRFRARTPWASKSPTSIGLSSASRKC